jgi:hypothetical protein
VPITGNVSASATPRSARFLLGATLVAFVAVLVRDLGVESPVWPWGWNNVYSLTELLAVAAVGLRAAATRGPERAACGSRSRSA